MTTPPTYPEGDWRKPNRKKRTEMLPGQAEFLDWLTTVDGRCTKAALAQQLGVSLSTLDNWRRDPIFVAEWEKRLSKLNVRPDRTQAVIDAMFEKAQSGDVKAAELYMRLVDRLTPNRLVLEDQRASELSDEELAAELERQVQHLRAV